MTLTKATAPETYTRAERLGATYQATQPSATPIDIVGLLKKLFALLAGGICPIPPTPKGRADYVNAHPRIVEASALRQFRQGGMRRRDAKHAASVLMDDLDNNPATEAEMAELEQP